VNVLVQQQHVGMVFRTIPAEIPNVDKLGLLRDGRLQAGE
jgi:Tfp pilus assembly ATPase PilU